MFSLVLNSLVCALWIVEGIRCCTGNMTTENIIAVMPVACFLLAAYALVLGISSYLNENRNRRL